MKRWENVGRDPKPVRSDMEMLGFVLKSMVTNMKNAFSWPIRRLGIAKERIGELERRSTEITQAEMLRQRGRRKIKQRNRASRSCGTRSGGLTGTIGFLQ